MKTCFVCIFALALTILTAGVLPSDANEVKTEEKAMLPKSMKGYNIYAFEKQGKLYFTLITGTNRQKSFEELDSDENIEGRDGWVRIRVEGVDKAKKLLQRVPSSPGLFVSCPIGDCTVDQTTIPPKITCPSLGVCDELMADFKNRNKGIE